MVGKRSLVSAVFVLLMSCASTQSNVRATQSMPQAAVSTQAPKAEPDVTTRATAESMPVADTNANTTTTGGAGAVAVQTASVEATRATPAPVVERRFNGHLESEILRSLDEGNVLSARSVGNTSLNFHVDLQGPLDGGYKPSESQHLEHYRSEVAAFRFNQLMGLERVPPAVLRKVSMDAVKHIPREVLSRAHVHRGELRGAMIYWVPVLRQVGLNSSAFVARWSRWLRANGEIPQDQRWRAEEISTVIAFDYLTANWDRWHGDNTLVDAQGHLVYRDNNGAFFEHIGDRRTQLLETWLHRTQRFSRKFIDRARTLTAAEIEQFVNKDIDARRPLLSTEQVASIIRRRDALIQYVDGLIAQHGEQAVYAFD